MKKQFRMTINTKPFCGSEDDSFDDDPFEGQGSGALAVELAPPKLQRPPLYRVLLLNDNYTTMEFVISVLQTVFQHNEDKAAQIMMHVHQKGAGICGIYTREIAETKVAQVMEFAKQNEHPLQCTMEPDTDGEGK